MHMNEIQNARSQRFSQLIGLELKAEFARKEISQTSVADALGHSRTSYSKWMNAKPSMPFEAFLNTCELIGSDPRVIMNAAYNRLIDEMGEYGSDSIVEPSISDNFREAKIRDMIANPEKYDLAANHDKYKRAESEMPLD